MTAAILPFPRTPRLVSLCGWRVGDTGFYRGQRIAVERIDAERRMLAIRCNGGLDYMSPSVLHRADTDAAYLNLERMMAGDRPCDTERSE